ncbi:DUF2513 domain-containing protein [Catenibacterium mitsuokai]|uniref:DUF2513 domain-containing protein n=1 Tax=Catenibacterium mitsuokai TaxID=100886 RepID=UPI0024186A5B
MELNKDCVRDVLLSCEELLKIDEDGYMNSLSHEELGQVLPNYKTEDIIYTVVKLKEAGFLDVKVTRASGNILVDVRINDITFTGHEFLNDIRDDNNWKKVKEIAKSVGAFSINMIAQIAVGVIQTNISALM